MLADLVESDRECAYVTVKRQPLETLIEEWLSRGDQISMLCGLVTRAEKELAVAWADPARTVMQPTRGSHETMLRERTPRLDSPPPSRITGTPCGKSWRPS